MREESAVLGEGERERNCDGAVFEKIVHVHRPQIFRFLLASSRDVDLAETLTQECLLRAYRNWPKFRGDAKASTWLMRIAINLQRDYWRNRRVRFWRDSHAQSIDVGTISDFLPSKDLSPEARSIAREKVNQVWRAVGELSERQRTVFLLRVIDELTITETAAVTGLQEGTVKAHFSRAMSNVRTALRSEA